MNTIQSNKREKNFREKIKVYENKIIKTFRLKANI
jgi:hypothetical protein